MIDPMRMLGNYIILWTHKRRIQEEIHCCRKLYFFVGKYTDYTLTKLNDCDYIMVSVDSQTMYFFRNEAFSTPVRSTRDRR